MKEIEQNDIFDYKINKKLLKSPLSNPTIYI